MSKLLEDLPQSIIPATEVIHIARNKFNGSLPNLVIVTNYASSPTNVHF